MKKINNLILVLIASITLTISSNINVLAEEIDISEQYKNYEQLSDEAKSKIIKPNITGIKKDSITQSTNTKTKPKLKGSNTSLPASFSLRTQLNNIAVKDQGKTGSCWAFAYTTAMETTYYKTITNNGLVLSPLHMDYTTANIWKRVVGDGGNNEIAHSYLASNYGPVTESSFKFNTYYNTSYYSGPYYLRNIASVYPEDYSQQYRVKNMTVYPAINKSISGNTITYTDDSGSTYTIKEL